MTTSQIETQEARALKLRITDETMIVELSDGRELSVPLSWFPRLVYASKSERGKLGIVWRRIIDSLARPR